MPFGDQCDHYLSVELLDDTMVLDAVSRLREAYPHLLQVNRKVLRGSSPRRS